MEKALPVRPSERSVSLPRLAKGVIVSMRPLQWVKNILLFSGVFFSLSLFSLPVVVKVLAGFAVFSAAASGVYLFNDIFDRKNDALHPEKARRPIAAGEVPVPLAASVSLALVLFSLAASYALDVRFFLILAAYITVNGAYTVRLKHVVILDVIFLSSGFVLRVVAGSYLADVVPSDWLIICTTMLSLFLGFTKRRNELQIVGKNATGHRAVLKHYSISFLDQMIAVATAGAVMSYTLYTVADETVQRFGSRKLILTMPFVLYGVYRYFYLSHETKVGGNPAKTIAKDFPSVCNLLLWMGTLFVLMYVL